MSGICGIVELRGNEPPRRLIEAMTARLAMRGPDAQDTWAAGPVALGHALLATTPEALSERMPLADPITGCVIVADARIDNRSDLLDAFGLTDKPRVIGDGELILLAYRKWGTDCPGKLLGDFAFAVWDPQHARLFGARDHTGMRQMLYCHVPGKCFVFGTECASILFHPAVPKRLNKGRIADFIEDYLEGIDYTSTFFEQIYRLPPATSFTFQSGELKTTRYWTPEIGPLLRLRSDEAYAELFAETFDRCVSTRLRSVRPVGATMSGGIDSTSVAATAARLLQASKSGPLRTYSAVGPDSSQCRETRTIQLAAQMHGIIPTFVRFDQLGDAIGPLREATLASREPFDFEMSLIHAVYHAASRDGVNVVLDGVAGDVVLNDGNQVDHLIRKGNLVRAYHELAGQMSFHGIERRPTLWWMKRVAAVAATPLGRGLVRGIKRRMLPRGFSDDLVFDSAFASSVNLLGRRRIFFDRYGSTNEDQRQTQLRRILHTFPVVGRERYDRVAAQHGIETRDPFMDRRLVEFCLRLPGNQLLRNGWMKVILRNATGNCLPDGVAWRKGKEHLGGEFIRVLVDHAAGDDVDATTAKKLIEMGILRPNFSSAAAISKESKRRIAALSVWLEKTERLFDTAIQHRYSP